jgi:probable rRNA maturation factor
MAVEIINKNRKFSPSLRKIRNKTNLILKYLDLEDMDLSIVLADDRQIRSLNRRCLKKDRPTDVLAFSMLEAKAIGNSKLLGDVVISLDTAARISRRLKKDSEEEFFLYLIHGILHLIGYRDGSRSERRVMEEMQNKILESIL